MVGELCKTYLILNISRLLSKKAYWVNQQVFFYLYKLLVISMLISVVQGLSILTMLIVLKLKK